MLEVRKKIIYNKEKNELRKKMLRKNQFATCIPLTSGTEEMLWNEIDHALDQNPDYIEWRRDYFLEDAYALEIEYLKKIKEKLGETGLIYTFRNKREGGFCQVEEKERLKFIDICAKSGTAAYIDIELESSDAFLVAVKELTRKNNTGLLISHHDFEKTYSEKQIVDIFNRMNAKGADVLKLAMYAQNKEDVQRLVAVVSAYGLKFEAPIIAISMGEAGCISRIIPDILGGSLTYASGAESTAPGQMTVREILELRRILGVIS